MPAASREKKAADLPSQTVALGDCVARMRAWPKQSVDLIFADPPYNIGFQYDGHYVDQRPEDEYLGWTYDWIDAAADLLKPTGSFYILIGDEYAAETRIHLKKLQRQGKLLFRNWIVWHYTFGQRCKIKFNRSHAHLFYCVGRAAVNQRTGKPKSNLVKSPPFTFHYDQVAVPSARMTTYNDSRQNPHGKLPDDTWVLKFPALENWHVRPQDAAQEGSFDAGWDTWFKSRLAGTFKEREQWHPCQLPEALLERIVRCSSNPGDLVFDPFAGSGTTLAVAHRLGRRWLGCELSPEYRKKALQRIAADPAERDIRSATTRKGRDPARRSANAKSKR
ncbi:MAG: site-specific DNA-methyltransferase [Planctomycetota bacterium]